LNSDIEEKKNAFRKQSPTNKAISARKRILLKEYSKKIARSFYTRNSKMTRFSSGEVVFDEILTPSVSPPFSNSENGEKIGIPLHQIPFFGIWGRQEGVIH
jgi:hypothetical protein